jgi:hypothetical protein
MEYINSCDPGLTRYTNTNNAESIPMNSISKRRNKKGDLKTLNSPVIRDINKKLMLLSANQPKTNNGDTQID